MSDILLGALAFGIGYLAGYLLMGYLLSDYVF